MRVNITYSVELDQIPNKVSELLEEAYPSLVKLQEQVHQIESSLKAGHSSIEEEINRIDSIRRILASVDYKMMDCAEILQGYQSTLVEMRRQRNKPERENDKEGVQKTEEG